MSGLLTGLLGLLGRGFKLGTTIPQRVPRAFRRPPRGRVVAETNYEPWMPCEPAAPPEWWPPDKELR